MVKKYWKKNGKRIKREGKYVKCEDCPCVTLCAACDATPAEILLTVPAGTFAVGGQGCANGCAILEGDFVCQQSDTNPCVWVYYFPGTANDFCVGDTLEAKVDRYQINLTKFLTRDVEVDLYFDVYGNQVQWVESDIGSCIFDALSVGNGSNIGGPGWPCRVGGPVELNAL